MSGIYANPESASERLDKAIIWNLKRIKKSGGYRNDVALVADEIIDVTPSTPKPCIVYIPGREVVTNEDMSDGLLHKRLDVTLLCFLHTNLSARTAWNTLRQDIESRFGAVPDAGYFGNHIPGEDGVETAMDAYVSGSEPFGMYNNKPQAGIAVTLRVFYRQNISDPTVTA